MQRAGNIPSELAFIHTTRRKIASKSLTVHPAHGIVSSPQCCGPHRPVDATLLCGQLDDDGPDVTLTAGVEPHLLAAGTEKQVREATKYILDQCAQVGGRLMLGTADDVPYGAPARNLAAVSEVVEKYGYGL